MKIIINKIITLALTSNSNPEAFASIYRVAMAKNPTASKTDIDLHFAAFTGDLIVKIIQESARKQKVLGYNMKQIYYPLSDRYKKSKIRNTSRFWMHTGWTIRNLSSWVSNDKVYIGFRDNVRHPNSKAYAQSILAYNDNGTMKTVARPLLSTILQDYVFNFDKYVNLYLEYLSKVRIA